MAPNGAANVRRPAGVGVLKVSLKREDAFRKTVESSAEAGELTVALINRIYSNKMEILLKR